MKYAIFTILFSSCLLFIYCGQTKNESSVYSISEFKTIKTGKAPGTVLLADFNHDSNIDIAIANESDSSVSIFLNDGSGNFTEAKGSPFYAGYFPNDIAAGDFNKDGNIDLAFANHDRKYFTVILGKGDGSFERASNSPFKVEVFPHVHGITTGDFNGDGRLDVAVDSWGNDLIELVFGDSLNLFKTPGIYFKVGHHPYQRVRSADVNGDGFVDIITSNLDGNNATVLLNDGKGNFINAPGSPFPCGDAPFGVAIGDINGDKEPDLAILNSPGSTANPDKGINGLTILTGDGSGKFMTMNGSPFECGKNPNLLAIGDLNGDGINDIVVSDYNGDNIYLFLMSKNGMMSSNSVVVGNHPKGVAIADLNKDGKGDIVVCNNFDNNISIIFSR